MAEEKTAAAVGDPETADLFAAAESLKRGDKVDFKAPPAKEAVVEKAVTEAVKTATEKPTEKAEDKATDKAETDPVKLRAQVDGLKKELARTRPKADDMAAMRTQLAELEGRLKQATETKKAAEAGPVYTDVQLATFQDEWDKVLRAARDGDGTALLGDGRTVTTAEIRRQLALIDTEMAARRVARATEAATIKAENEAMLSEAASLIEEGRTLFPDLQDKESDLFKAANTEYLKRAKLMKALGPYADLVAVSLAVSKQPILLGKTDTKARATLLHEIEQTAESALSKGGGSADIKTVPDFTSMKPADVLAFAERLKSGAVSV